MSGDASFARAVSEGRLLFDEPTAGHCSFRAGGPADIFAAPASEDELCAFVRAFLSLGIPVFPLGGGSNVLFPDAGFRGAVLSTERLDSAVFLPPENGTIPIGQEEIERVSGCAADGCSGGKTESGVFLRCGGGCPMDRAVALSVESGFAGLERFAGLPGTVGGAAFMNARCYDRSVSDVFARAELIRFSALPAVPEGEDETREARAVRVSRGIKLFRAEEWAYKRSPFNAPPAAGSNRADGSDGAREAGRAETVILSSVVFRLSPGDRDFLRAETEKYRADREQKGHFRLPSAGSVFKNNRAFGKPSGVLIDEAGLRGLRLGGAQVAPWHGNIIVNTGNATASDIRALTEEVARRVFARTGFRLEPEVIFAGDGGGVGKPTQL